MTSRSGKKQTNKAGRCRRWPKSNTGSGRHRWTLIDADRVRSRMYITCPRGTTLTRPNRTRCGPSLPSSTHLLPEARNGSTPRRRCRPRVNAERRRCRPTRGRPRSTRMSAVPRCRRRRSGTTCYRGRRRAKALSRKTLSPRASSPACGTPTTSPAHTTTGRRWCLMPRMPTNSGRRRSPTTTTAPRPCLTRHTAPVAVLPRQRTRSTTICLTVCPTTTLATTPSPPRTSSTFPSPTRAKRLKTSLKFAFWTKCSCRRTSFMRAPAVVTPAPTAPWSHPAPSRVHARPTAHCPSHRNLPTVTLDWNNVPATPTSRCITLGRTRDWATSPSRRSTSERQRSTRRLHPVASLAGRAVSSSPCTSQHSPAPRMSSGALRRNFGASRTMKQASPTRDSDAVPKHSKRERMSALLCQDQAIHEPTLAIS
eukprot:m.1387757 g.1387757  ORF g.1387757 m.1387757 type:complete len:424 (-) comp24984_c0_seq5:2358-3629(-)